MKEQRRLIEALLPKDKPTPEEISGTGMYLNKIAMEAMQQVANLGTLIKAKPNSSELKAQVAMGIASLQKISNAYADLNTKVRASDLPDNNKDMVVNMYSGERAKLTSQIQNYRTLLQAMTDASQE